MASKDRTFKGGIQPGMVAADAAARKLDGQVKKISEAVGKKLASRGFLRVRKLSQEDIPGGIGSCEPDGGIWYYNGVPIAAFEGKKQDLRGNAIERWFKNEYVLRKINPDISYVTFGTGNGADLSRKNNVFERTLNIAHPEGFDRVVLNGNSCFLSPDGFSPEFMESIMLEVLLSYESSQTELFPDTPVPAGPQKPKKRITRKSKNGSGKSFTEIAETAIDLSLPDRDNIKRVEKAFLAAGVTSRSNTKQWISNYKKKYAT